jgi:hypothetical protein
MAPACPCKHDAYSALRHLAPANELLVHVFVVHWRTQERCSLEERSQAA